MTAAERALDEVRETYARCAGTYDFFVRSLTLGMESRLRRSLVHRLALRPEDTVLDVACGTGLNFEAIQRSIGPGGRLIGLDLSSAMLSEAHKKVAAFGWDNVTLIQANAATLPQAGQVDAALCTFAIGLMPDPDSVVRGMVAAVRSGRSVLLADGHLAAGWHGLAMNPLVRWAGAPWVPAAVRDQYWTGRPWETLKGLVRDFHYQEWLGGFLYVAWGRRDEMAS